MDIAEKPIEIFYSYSHKDEPFRQELEKHLSSLRQQGYIEEWHDRMIIAGTDWAYDIDTHLSSAALILLLISPDFMMSDYCLSIEMKRAMEQHYAGEAWVIPILLKHVDWEGAPFAQLQVLPSGARPITTWDNMDEAFLDVSKGIRAVIERLRGEDIAFAASANQDITRFPGGPTGYFMSLENYLKPSRLRFPTQEDFERDLVYAPQEHLADITHALHEKRRVLLTGPAAAGKTVLAIALAQQLQQNERYKIAYQDVDRAKEGEGHKWYQLMRAHDRKGVLYILDNCHLAPEEVNEFCRQWEEEPPSHAQCLLISRAYTDEEEAAWTVYHYFEACMDATLKARSEDVYWGMLEKYASYYQRQNPLRYTALLDDKAELLKKQHAYNLVVSKSRLEAWSELGGRLSEVKQEAVYTAMIKRYFARWKESLPKLCVLRQYEIRAHNFFVEAKLPAEEVTQLQEEKLLTSATEQNYGMFYDLVVHPAEAREIFEAYIYYQHGRVTWKHVRNSTIEALRAYLKVGPLNYLQVYERLARQKQKRILEILLKDRELQECAANQFEMGNIADSIGYLSRLARIDAARARELLARLVEDTSIRDICTGLLEHPFQERTQLLQSVQQIDATVAQRVAIAIDLQRSIKQVEEQNIQRFFAFMRVLKDILPQQKQAQLLSVPIEGLAHHITSRNFLPVIEQLRELGYPSIQIEQFAELLVVEKLLEHTERIEHVPSVRRENLQHMYAMLRLLKEIAPEKAALFLEKTSQELLVQRAWASHMNLVGQFIGLMQELGVRRLEQFIEAIGVEWFVQKAARENLQHLYWILHMLQRIAPATANMVLETLTPQGLAALCRVKEASIGMVEQFHKVSSKQFWPQFLRQFTPNDMADIFSRSSLGAIGNFLKPRYFYFRLSYQLFCDTTLKERLQTESLEEIGKFLARIRQIPEVGDDLVSDVVSLLVDVDIAQRVAHTDLQQFALLLYNARSVHNTYLLRLLVPLKQPDCMRMALEKSKLSSIQIFIHNVAGIDSTPEKRYMQAIHCGLRAVDLKESLADAEIVHLTSFLWNVYKHIDPELAQEYGRLMDGQERIMQLEGAPLVELCSFLWNLLCVSALTEPLRTLDEPIIQERLLIAWSDACGHAAALLGVLVMGKSTHIRHLPPIQTPEQREHIVNWLLYCIEKQEVFLLALTLYGLRFHNEAQAEEYVHSVSVEQLEKLFVKTKATALALRSEVLLEEIIAWLSSTFV